MIDVETPFEAIVSTWLHEEAKIDLNLVSGAQRPVNYACWSRSSM
jgi:hypothetical protein